METNEDEKTGAIDLAKILWWGFSSEHGWVILDRSIEPNKPGASNDLLFFKCCDSTFFSEIRDKWNPPLYAYAPRYLEQLNGDNARRVSANLKAFQDRALEFHDKIFNSYAVIRRRDVERNHRERLASLGVSYQGVSPARTDGHRTTDCYGCEQFLDNWSDLECNICGWIICRYGHCGCGYVDKKIK